MSSETLQPRHRLWLQPSLTREQPLAKAPRPYLEKHSFLPSARHSNSTAKQTKTYRLASPLSLHFKQNQTYSGFCWPTYDMKGFPEYQLTESNGNIGRRWRGRERSNRRSSLNILTSNVLNIFTGKLPGESPSGHKRLWNYTKERITSKCEGPYDDNEDAVECSERKVQAYFIWAAREHLVECAAFVSSLTKEILFNEVVFFFKHLCSRSLMNKMLLCLSYFVASCQL